MSHGIKHIKKHRRHPASRRQMQIDLCCSGKYSLFIVGRIQTCVTLRYICASTYRIHCPLNGKLIAEITLMVISALLLFNDAISAVGFTYTKCQAK
jgi:hypothetical protein